MRYKCKIILRFFRVFETSKMKIDNFLDNPKLDLLTKSKQTRKIAKISSNHQSFTEFGNFHS